jgi:hypothetical protein
MEEENSGAVMKAVWPDCEGVSNVDGGVVAKYSTHRCIHAFCHGALSQRCVIARA